MIPWNSKNSVGCTGLSRFECWLHACTISSSRNSEASVMHALHTCGKYHTDAGHRYSALHDLRCGCDCILDGRERGHGGRNELGDAVHPAVALSAPHMLLARSHTAMWPW